MFDTEYKQDEKLEKGEIHRHFGVSGTKNNTRSRSVRTVVNSKKQFLCVQLPAHTHTQLQFSIRRVINCVSHWPMTLLLHLRCLTSVMLAQNRKRNGLKRASVNNVQLINGQRN